MQIRTLTSLKWACQLCGGSKDKNVGVEESVGSRFYTAPTNFLTTGHWETPKLCVTCWVNPAFYLFLSGVLTYRTEGLWVKAGVLWHHLTMLWDWHRWQRDKTPTLGLWCHKIIRQLEQFTLNRRLTVNLGHPIIAVATIVAQLLFFLCFHATAELFKLRL